MPYTNVPLQSEIGSSQRVTLNTKQIYVHASLISVCALVLYLANGWFFYPSGDTIPASLTPFSILLHGNVYIGRYFDLPQVLKLPHYYIVPSHGDFVSYTYYIGTSLTALPVYILYLLFGGAATLAGGAVVGKISASVICAASVFLLYVLLRKLSIRPWLSIVFTILYALGSETFAMSSQALWRHGPSELWVTVFLLATVHIFLHPRLARFAPHVAGLAMGMLFICRAQNFILVLPFIFLVMKKEYRTRVLASIPVFIVILVLWELFKFHYYHAGVASAVTSKEGALQGSFIQGLLGNTLSPSRGLFVFMPWAVFSFLWVRYVRRPSSIRAIYTFLTLGAVLYVVIYSMLTYWDAGTSFGPRYMADAIPVFVVLAAAYFEYTLGNARTGRITRVVQLVLLSLFGVWSIALQLLGAEVPMGVYWNRAVQPDYFHNAMWFVRDGEVSYYLHTLEAVSKPPIVVRHPSVSYRDLTLYNGGEVIQSSNLLLNPGQVYGATLLVTNNGTEAWSPYPSHTGYGMVGLGATVQTPDGKIDPSGSISGTYPLHTVYPGSSAKLYFTLRAPDMPGEYVYIFTMNQTGYGKFSNSTNSDNTYRVIVTVK